MIMRSGLVLVWPLHQVADELLPAWIEWSSQSDSFQYGVCEEKWSTFERLPGGPNPPDGRGLKTLRAMAKEDGWVDLGGYTALSFEDITKRVQQKVQNVDGDFDLDKLDQIVNSIQNIEDDQDVNSNNYDQDFTGFETPFGTIGGNKKKVKMVG